MFFCIWVLWSFNYAKENLISILDGLDLHHCYSDISPALFQEDFAKTYNQFSIMCICMFAQYGWFYVRNVQVVNSSLSHVVWEREIASSNLQISRKASP